MNLAESISPRKAQNMNALGATVKRIKKEKGNLAGNIFRMPFSSLKELVMWTDGWKDAHNNDGVYTDTWDRTYDDRY